MRIKQMTWLVLLVLGFGVFLVVSRYAVAKSSPSGETKQKWEYCRVLGSYRSGDNQYKAQIISASTPDGRIDEIESSFGGLVALNKLGAEGWEIVGILPNQSNPEYILKRPKP
jgi:hypothetical protein